MIDEIHVTDLALIRDAVLVPDAGLTVLTGETGAGKTALLSACRLLMGDRADSSLVREGQDAAYVEGRLFRDPHDTEGIVVARRVGADGRSRVKIDGALASVRELAQLVASQIDLCGQHEHQRLLDPATHVDMVDAWAGATVAKPLAAYREAFAAAREAARELERVEAAARTQGSRLEEARFALARIDEVDPGETELEQLEEVLPRAEHAEALVGCVHDAKSSIGDEDAALVPD